MEDIIKQFKIVFGLDSKPLDNGLKQSENNLKSFGKVFGGIVSTYFTYSIFKDVIKGFAEFNSQLNNSLALTGGNISNVYAMGNALKRFGGNTQDVISSMDSLNTAMQEAKFGGGALIEVAKKYGVWVDTSKGSEKALLSLSKQMGKMDRQTRVTIGRQLGLSDSMIRAFSDGGKSLEKLIQKQKDLGTITEDDVKISDNFNNAILDLKDMFSVLTREIARLFLPIITKVVELFTKFIDFVRKHKQLVIAFFAALAIALSPFLVVLGKMAIASVAAFAPFYAIIAVITAIAIVFEDLYYYFNGWNSATGELVKKFPVLKYIIEPLRPLVLGIYEIFSKIIDFLKEPSWENFKNMLKSIGNLLINVIKMPFEGISKIVDYLLEKFPSLSILLKPLKIIVDSIKDVFESILDIINNFSFDGLKNQLTSLKDSISDIGGNIIEKINPMNWFSGDDDKKIQTLQTPAIPDQNISNSSSVYNINNNINQNISSATPVQLANRTNEALINSINAQRQQRGAL
ncbi:hypothetical protein [Campylobacter sp.]|uniref:hypothetical protein n=1 Tax=Campylobacter sp. TaxID=205 RepID=UPI0025C69876|nr:hypothetical protein [Campylobacter sp.]